VRILSINSADLSPLQNLASSNVQAVSLDVPLQVVLSDPASMQALMQWVREGGTVLLHTDAAQLFGYRTVAPRQATNAVAGQSFGRARAALPFGANPLLWSLRVRRTRLVQAVGVRWCASASRLQVACEQLRPSLTCLQFAWCTTRWAQ
jgi:hypothetical protein